MPFDGCWCKGLSLVFLILLKNVLVYIFLPYVHTLDSTRKFLRTLLKKDMFWRFIKN